MQQILTTVNQFFKDKPHKYAFVYLTCDGHIYRLQYTDWLQKMDILGGYPASKNPTPQDLINWAHDLVFYNEAVPDPGPPSNNY